MFQARVAFSEAEARPWAVAAVGDGTWLSWQQLVLLGVRDQILKASPSSFESSVETSFASER
jgi:hypothetical protein